MQHTQSLNRPQFLSARWMAPLLLAAGVLIPQVASAQAIPNQSDTTGVNVNSLVSPDVLGAVLDEATIARAQAFLNQLEQARAACNASKQQASEQPRRFARGTADPTAVCMSAECMQYSQLMSEVRSFLSGLDRNQLERLRQLQASRLW